MINEMGKRIARKREARGWNQSDLARQVGCSRQTVNAWERGNVRGITGLNLRKLAAALGVEPEWILNGVSDRIGSKTIKDDPVVHRVVRRIERLTEAEMTALIEFLDRLDERQRKLYEQLKGRFEEDD